MSLLLNSLLVASIISVPIHYDQGKKGDQLRVGDFILKHNYAREDKDPLASAGELQCADNLTIVPISETEMNAFIQPIWAHNKAQQWNNIKQYSFDYFYQVDELPDDVVMNFYTDPKGDVKKVFTYDLVKAGGLAKKLEDQLRAKCDQASST